MGGSGETLPPQPGPQPAQYNSLNGFYTYSYMQDFVPSDSKYELQVQYCSEGAAKPSSCSNIGTKYAASKKSMDAKQFKSSPYLVDVPSGVVCPCGLGDSLSKSYSDTGMFHSKSRK